MPRSAWPSKANLICAGSVEALFFRPALSELDQAIGSMLSALIDAAILGDDDSNEMYKAALQDRIDSNLTGNHTARHKYVKVKGRRGLGDGKYS